MSIQKTRNILDDFLKKSEEGVLVIKGDWGIGKTYFFQNFLDENKKCSDYNFEQYSYVSLFGLSNVEDLKNAIIVNNINKNDIGANLTEAKALSLRWKLLKKLSSVVGKEVSTTSPWHRILLAWDGVYPKNALICIDDFERSTLKTEDILGIISFLKEERKCKVILIFNENKLKEHDEIYKVYREKVIDSELEYSPSVKECVNIVFCSQEGTMDAILSESCIKLGIRNIRILRKIKSLSVSLLEILTGFDNETCVPILQTLCLFCLSHYSEYSEEIPPVDFLTGEMSTANTLMACITSAKKESDPLEKKWKSILGDYGYGATDELDLLVYEGIKQGYFDKEKIKQKAEVTQQIRHINQGKSSFDELVREFYLCFQDNQDKYVKLLIKSARLNIKYIHSWDINWLAITLRELGGSGRSITKLINYYISSNKSHPSKFNFDRVTNDYVIDDEVARKFQKEVEKTKIHKTLSEVVDIMAKNSWAFEDEETLLNATEDELYDLFISRTGKKLQNAIYVTCKYLNRTPISEEQKAFNQRVKQTFNKIGNESKLNRMRLKYFDISIGE